MSISNPGQYHWQHTMRVVNPSIVNESVDYLVKRAGVRMLEEATELALVCGCSPGEIYNAIGDALHNEARKTNDQRYPSKLGWSAPVYSNILGEVVDVRICIDYIRQIAGVSQHSVNTHQDTKLELLSLQARDGALKYVDGNVYKKTSGR